MNRKGQFSIIAALLVAVVLISTVIMTYSTIRNSPIQEQPQIQSAIDETNLAAKQILGFTVGYYGSVLKSTGNTTYATELATNYLQSGLLYAANIHPEWGTSFNVTYLQLYTHWYSSTSFSNGNLTVSYNLTGLGISGVTYQTSCSLTVQVLPTVNNQAYLSIAKDGSEPLINLGKGNFNFYRYDAGSYTWNLTSPANEPLAYSNGTYEIDIPSAVDVNSYVVQVQDQRGIIVVASSYSLYTINLAWNVTSTQQQSLDHYVDLNSSPNQGTHSDFGAMQHGPDGLMDTLTENVTSPAVPEYWVSPFTGDNGKEWSNLANAYDNNTSTYASDNIKKKQWSAYITLQGSSNGLSCHMIRYFIGRSTSDIGEVQIDVFTNKWINVYDGAGTWNQWANQSLGAELSVSKMRFRFKNSDTSSSRSAYVYEAQFLKSTTPQNCQLNLEIEWTGVNYTDKNQWLCIYGGAMAPENIQVDVKNGGGWTTLFPDLISGWNNISVSPYLVSANFTIRFIDGTPTGDPVQDSWQIDAALLHSSQLGSSSVCGTVVVELLQNGTMRWLGQNLQQTLLAKPIPPIPVKSIHVNQTESNVNAEVPFQVEDWASDYRIPLGLTNNASVFSGRTMLVFLANSNVSQVTVWWNGSDTVTQTPYAYTNRYFTGDDANSGILTNGILSLTINTGSFQVKSTQGTSTATATFMRINGENSVYGSEPAFTIHHGVIRDIVTQEAEWSTGAPNCPNLYACMVVTLPANATYYTYQLRIIFLDSQQTRIITDLCPMTLTVPTGSPQTENGTSAGDPIVSSAAGLFYNQAPSCSAHHWSQFVSGTKGAGIMFTDDANQRLYFFDTPGKPSGAISVSNSSGNVIELQPVASTLNPVNNFQSQSDVTWYGAVATFDGTMPIYQNSGGVISGLWMSVEYLPVITVTTGS